MNIGITTFQWANNYGAVLQAHALQSFLRERGHAVQIVDYRVKSSFTGLRRWIAKTPYRCVRKWEAAYKEYVFELFRERYMARTPSVFYSVVEMESIADKFDMLITGSDQVWNPRFLSQVDGFFDLYFLSFAAPQTRRVAYAASIGHSEKATMKEEWQEILSEKLQKMDAISVREPSGVDLVNSLCGRSDAVQVVDPTLLLERKHYEKIAGETKGWGKYLFSYMLHGMDRDAGEACRHITEARNVQVMKCDAKKTNIHRGYVLPSPTGWLKRIKNAPFVATNSFHCVVFCLIFHVPFIALLIDGQIGSMNSRIVELLKEVRLTNRILSPQEDIPAGMCAEEINWDIVDQKIVAMREKSVEFLADQGL